MPAYCVLTRHALSYTLMEIPGPSDRGRIHNNVPFFTGSTDDHPLIQGEITAPDTTPLVEAVSPAEITVLPSASEAGTPELDAQQRGWEQCATYEETVGGVLNAHSERKTCLGIAPYEQFIVVHTEQNGVPYSLEIDYEHTVRVTHSEQDQDGKQYTVKEAFYPDYGGQAPSVRIDENGYLALTSDQVAALLEAGIDSENPVITPEQFAELTAMLERAQPPRTEFDDIWRLANDLAVARPATAEESHRGAREFSDYIERRVKNHEFTTTGAERESLQETGRYTKNLTLTDLNKPEFAHTVLEYTVMAHEPVINGSSLRLIRHRRLDADGQPAATPDTAACERIEGLHIIARDGQELTCGIFGVTAYQDSYIEDEPIVHVRSDSRLARMARDLILDHPG
jgi:hypothetical protein